MKMKTTTMLHFTLSGMDKLEETDNTKCGQVRCKTNDPWKFVIENVKLDAPDQLPLKTFI